MIAFRAATSIALAMVNYIGPRAATSIALVLMMVTCALPAASTTPIYAGRDKERTLSQKAAQPGWTSICAGPIMENLHYNLSHVLVPQTLPDPARGETLAQAICCDDYYRSFHAAEPSGLFSEVQNPHTHTHTHTHTRMHAGALRSVELTSTNICQVDLFSKAVMVDGSITFFDSVCGVPLFTAPKNRTLQQFEDESILHGWPSFRDAEVHLGNVVTEADGSVRSKCGTYLGSLDKDREGTRYCINLVCIAGNPASWDAVPLVTFDGAPDTTFKWNLINDPVMGGLSSSSFVIAQNIGVFNGTVAIVPKLQAPGFCNAETNLFKKLHPSHFNDVSNCTHLVLVLRSSTPEFHGFKVSFAANTLDPLFKSYKANFAVPSGGSWQSITVPFSSFSNDWSPFTGDCDTTDPTGRTHRCCHDHPGVCARTHPRRSHSPRLSIRVPLCRLHRHFVARVDSSVPCAEVCPTDVDLKSISQIGIWAEGHAGDFHLEILSINGA